MGPGVLREISSPRQQPMEIAVIIGHQYGQEVIRPACPTAEIFCEIARTKTLTRQLVEQIKRLGYTVRVQRTEPEQL